MGPSEIKYNNLKTRISGAGFFVLWYTGHTYSIYMSEEKLKRKIAWSGTGICLLAFLGGYVAGMLGWWFLVILIGVVYFIIYNSLGH